MNFIKQYKDNLGESRPWHVAYPSKKVSEEIFTKRYEICQACPEFIKLTDQCKKCACFMKLKARLNNAVCPIGKW
jgi:hypothetical protein